MPPVLPNELELNLKKRARRRLVGAIALVLIMIIVLPMILKDRAASSTQDAIKITMTDSASVASSNKPEDDFNSAIIPVSPEVASTQTAQLSEVNPLKNTQSATEQKITAKTVTDSQLKEAKIAVLKTGEPKAVDTKTSDISTKEKNVGSFTVQVGVFSDSGNVKQLQEKIKQVGYASKAEKISTDKGEKIRLRAGSFMERSEALVALAKLKDAGLPNGQVISTE